jgi:hypothetical protein
LRILVKTITSFLFAAIMVSVCQSKEKTVVSTSSLTTEELQVYRALLNLLNSVPKTQVKNLANQTSPFDISDVPEGSVCLEGIEFENPSQGSRTMHSFGAEITKGMALKLVDPPEQVKILQQKDSASPKQKHAEDSAKGSSESGLLVVSEIAFDKKHQFAVLNYVFSCGSQCKYEITRVLEKVGGEWTTPVRRVCTVSLN